jgi:hypothetical protein
MISVSDEFKALWRQKHGVRVRKRILVWRRYWDGAAFVNEATSRILTEADVVSFGVVPHEVDSPLRNVYRTEMVTIRVYNEQNQWVASPATPSFFAADIVSGDRGYRFHKTLMQIQTGYELRDGTVEWVPRFTGWCLSRPSMGGGVAEIQLASKSGYLLEKSDAAEVSEAVGPLEDCSPATGDGANLSFATSSSGVDYLDDVQVNGTSINADEYSADNFNQVPVPGNAGTVTLTMAAAPTAGYSVKCSGLKWLQNKTIEYLLAAIFTAAGIAADEYQVDPVTVPGDAAASHPLDSQADFETYDTAVNATTTQTPGSLLKKWFLIDDFSDLEYTSNPVWTVLNSAGTSISAASGNLVTGSNVSPGNGQPCLSTPFTKNTGVWRFNNGGGLLHFMMNSNGTDGLGNTTGTGYAVWRPSSTILRLLRMDGYNNGELSTTLISITVTAGTREVQVSRTADGVFTLYVDGVSKGTVTDTTYSTAAYMIFNGFGSTIGGIYWSGDTTAIGTTPSSATTVVTYIIDLLSTPTALGLLDRSQALNGGSVTYKTACAVDSAGSPGTFDALTEIDSNGQMLSAPNQWLKLEITITPNGYDTPEVQRIVINFTVSELTVSLAVHSGLTGQAATEQYVGFVDYETGDDANGHRFVRSKDTSADPAVDLNQESGVIEILSADTGEDAICNVGRARQGGFVSTYRGSDAGEASPTSEDEYGPCLPQSGEISLPEIMLANSVNITAARARLAYQRGYLAKPPIRAIIWDVPWLETGDVVTFSLYDHPKLRQIIAFDPLNRAGSQFFMAGEAENIIARDLRMKVLELKPDLDTDQAEVLLETIL